MTSSPPEGTTLDVLLIEDNPGDARLIEEMLDDGSELLRQIDVGRTATSGTELHRETRLSAGVERLVTADVVLLDLDLPDSDGLDTLMTVLEAESSVPIVVLTGLRDEEMGLEAIQRGAQDYLTKDEVTSDLLVRSVYHAIERHRQERERARRRTQLEGLNTVSRTLMNAETTTEASEYVVEAAPELLGLPVVALALYDEDTGHLELAGATGRAAEAMDTESLLAVGDGTAWQVFTRAEQARIPWPEHCSESGGQAISELAIVPLASHGVFLVGSTGPEGFSAADVDFVETVAGNLEATFDRLDRVRTLHEREAALEAQNVTLERLNRVNDIIRNIARALVEADSREEIDAVVCQQLADVGPYELAWIGALAEDEPRIEPREAAGAEDDYPDAISIRTGQGPKAQGPTGRAVRSGQVQVVDDVVEDPSFEPWRREALGRGFHASVALPISFEGNTYGVLNVYAAQPGVFDDLEVSVLTELADIIAYAIDAVEHKEKPGSDEVTEVTLSVTDPALAVLAVTRERDCEVSIAGLVSRADGGTRAYVATSGAAAADVTDLRDRLPVEELTLVTEGGEKDGSETSCLYEAELTDESLVRTVQALGGRLGSFRVAGGSASVTVVLDEDRDVGEFVEGFRSAYPESELVDRRTRERPLLSPTAARRELTDALTDRQCEALQTAYFGGFFETPRVYSSRDVADSMDVSQPTVGEHLREAHRKICRGLFEAEADGTSTGQ